MLLPVEDVVRSGSGGGVREVAGAAEGNASSAVAGCASPAVASAEAVVVLAVGVRAGDPKSL